WQTCAFQARMGNMPRRHDISQPRRRFLAGSAAAGAYLLAACGSDAPAPKHPTPPQPGPAKPRVFERGNLGSVIGGGRTLDTESGEVRHFVGMVDLDETSPVASTIGGID